MDVLALILKVFGAVVTFISGLTALNFPTRDQQSLTTFGRAVLSALIVGIFCSAGGVVLDFVVKRSDDEQIRELKLAADGSRYTTADATVSITISVDKSLPALKDQVAKLDRALESAKRRCRSPGDVAVCDDYLIRSVIIDELRFTNKSALFPQRDQDERAFGIMSGLGVFVRFYNAKFTPSPSLKNSIGAMILSESTISGTTLFEYDASRLRWVIDGKLPPDAFKVAGVLSIVDLLGRGATAQPYAQGTDACPKESIEHDCDIHLRELLRATKIELIAFRFPHRKNFGFFGVAENRSEDAFNIPYVFENFPRTVDKFNESMRSSEED